MRSARRLLAVILVLSALLVPAMGVGAAASDEVLDQAYDRPPSSWVDLTPHLAQTFTAGRAGLLSRVDLYLAADFGTTNTITVDIRAVDASGWPTATILATTTETKSGFESGEGWVSFAFAAPASVTPGTQYALTATLSGPQSSAPWAWSNDSLTASPGSYAGGNTFNLTTSGRLDNVDFLFKTYVSMPAASTEVLYLLDDAGPGSALYQVTLDAATSRANLTPVSCGTVGYDSVALAATPDGARLFVIGGGGRFGSCEVSTGTFTEIAGGVTAGATPVTAIVQAAFSPGNTLFAVSDRTAPPGSQSRLYRIDPGTGAATNLGPIVAQPSGVALIIDGADLAFATDGTLYLWTNGGVVTDAPKGLYRVTLPSGPGGQVTATRIGAGTSAYVNGLALTDNGAGNPIALAAGTPGLLVVLDKASGTATTTYTLSKDGVTFPAQGGDLSIGLLDGPPNEPPVVSAAFATSTAGCGVGNAPLHVSFTDTSVGETHTATVDWGDGNTETLGAVTSPFTATHTYARAGSYNATVTVTDSGGAPGTDSDTGVRVDYVIVGEGVLAPLNQDGSSVFKYGSTIPVKLQVADCDGTYPADLAPRLSLVQLSGNPPAQAINEPSAAAAADTMGVMRFASADQQYIYNLATKSLSDPTATYEITVTLPNGQTVTETFGLRT